VIEVVPLTLHIGAEIRGADLSQPLPLEQLKAVRDAFLKWKVIFFRDQNLDHAQHVAMARSSVSRRSVMPCLDMSKVTPRFTRWRKTGPQTRNTKRWR
jgi:alpha-ketoglutarate-dependent taurine dioxygenase